MARDRPPTKAELWKQFLAHIEAQRQIEIPQPVMEIDLRRDQFNNREQRVPDIIYEPTQSSNPADPRTAAMQYWKDEQVMRVEWGDGGRPYLYFDVSPAEARRFVKVKSPGRFINRVLNAKLYGPA